MTAAQLKPECRVKILSRQPRALSEATELHRVVSKEVGIEGFSGVTFNPTDPI